MTLSLKGKRTFHFWRSFVYPFPRHSSTSGRDGGIKYPCPPSVFRNKERNEEKKANVTFISLDWTFAEENVRLAIRPRTSRSSSLPLSLSLSHSLHSSLALVVQGQCIRDLGGSILFFASLFDYIFAVSEYGAIRSVLPSSICDVPLNPILKAATEATFTVDDDNR